MKDLKERLGQLVDEATMHAVTPNPEVVVRRGRRRRRRQITGTMLVAALAAGLLLAPAGVLELPGRLGLLPDGGPSASPDGADGTTPIGYAGYWYGKIDASVYLTPDVSDQQLDAIREQLEALDVVDEVFYESRAEAFSHFQEQLKDVPRLREHVDPTLMPESLRVRLDDPAEFEVLQRALCRTVDPVTRCVPGVEVVIDQHEALRGVLLGSYWPGRTDVSVFLTQDVSPAQRAAVQARLEATGLAEEVFYESPAEASQHKSEQLRREFLAGEEVLLPPSFRVRLRPPVTGETIARFTDAFCDSRQTGDCAPGVAMVIAHERSSP